MKQGNSATENEYPIQETQQLHSSNGHTPPDIQHPTGQKGHVAYSVAGVEVVASPKSHQTIPLHKSFGYALSGLSYVFRTQRNARIHGLIAACALSLGMFLPLQRWEWIVLVLACTLVLAAEILNTAVEATVDLVTSTYQPLARIAKDVAAGAVMLCAIGSVVLGCIIFIPHLWILIISFMES